MAKTRITFCRVCEALCGLEVSVEGGRITAVRPDPAHVTTRGFACAKGLRQHLLYDSPDRLTHPARRRDGRWERQTWDQAFARIGGKLRSIREAHGPDAVALYVGSAAGFSLLHPAFAQGLMTGLGSRSQYSSATQDCSNKFAVARQMYGFPFTQPFPDVDHCGCLILVGTNPRVSQMSFLHLPDPAARLRDVVQRGGQLFHVDPRRTETARAAGEHVFIRPDTDVFFYLSFLNHLLELGAVDRARVRRYMAGLRTLERVAAPWPPGRTAPVTGIPAEVLERMVQAYAAARGAALFCSTGVNMGRHGSLAFWLQEVINAVSGNLDRRGGTLVGRGGVDLAGLTRRSGMLTRDDLSRVGRLPAVSDCFPGGALADEILTPGEGQVRALICTGGNPLASMPTGGRLRQALSSLELLVVVDILPTETAALAHHVLPATSPFERPDVPFVFPLVLGLQAVPYLQATEAVVAPADEQRDEASIFLGLARGAGVNLFGSRVAQRVLQAGMDLARARHPGRLAALSQQRLLSLLLRAMGLPAFGSLLRRHPHGLLLPGHTPGDFLGQRVPSDSGRVELAPPALVAASVGLEREFVAEVERRHELRLVGRRTVRTQNWWTHNHESFVRGDRRTNYLYIHPDDAGARKIRDGDLVDVTSATATVRLPARLDPDLMPGTVSIPHGYGHQAAPGQRVASGIAGDNVNLLAASGPDAVERISGMARLTGIPVEVTPAAEGLAADSWSGLPP